MRKLLILLTAATLTLSAQNGKTQLKVGDKAPDFELKGSDNKSYTLSQFKGHKNVVMAFFPFAFTGGWTKEMTGYQSGIKKFNDMDTQVLGVSVDSGPTLNHWSKELNAEFPLLSDFNKKVATAYGVLNNNGFCNRTTFVIDSDGVIQSIEEGNSAVNPTGAEEACSRLAHKKK